MASRAHAVRDYSFGNIAARPRSEAWYRRDDPVVLPRSRGWSIDYRLIAAALAASSLVAAATYGLFYTPPPIVAETAELAPGAEWALDTAALESAHVTRALSGPALAARDVPTAQQRGEPEVFFDEATAGEQATSSDTMSTSPDLSPAAIAPPEVFPKPSVPTDTPSDATPAPYPNPTTTPPDAIAPPEMSPVDAPKIDAENPYR